MLLEALSVFFGLVILFYMILLSTGSVVAACTESKPATLRKKHGITATFGFIATLITYIIVILSVAGI